MNPSDTDRVLALFRLAADETDSSVAGAPARSVDDDRDELLTAWRLGILSPDEQDRFLALLDSDPDFRRLAGDMVPLHDEPPVPAVTPYGAIDLRAEPTKSSRWPAPAVWGTVAALAACLLIALGWVFLPGGAEREFARAERDLRAGNADAAFARLAGVKKDQLPAALQAERERLLETAAYRAGRTALEAGRFDDVANTHAAATAAGVSSGRLDNLHVLAGQKIPGEVVLAMKGSLLDRGFMPDGEVPIRSVPVPNDRLASQWEAAVRSHPDSAELLLNYGEFLLNQNRYEEAAEAFRRAIAADPDNPMAHNGLGLALAANDRGPPTRFDLALEQFREAERLAPDSVPILTNIAVCLEAKGDRKAARAYWERLLRLATDEKLRDRIAAHLRGE